jgi:hypothetical protein
VKIEEHKCLSSHAQQVDISAHLDLHACFHDSILLVICFGSNSCSRTLMPSLYWKFSFVIGFISALPHLNMEHLSLEMNVTKHATELSMRWAFV